MGSERHDDLEALSALAEPIRRSLYEFVAASDDSVSRDEAAAAVGVSRQVAAHHLDRLAADGLLDVEFRRLTGKSGPGAGRPAKLYRRSDREHHVSVPPRRYVIAAQILLDAARAGGLPREALEEAARRAGKEIGKRGLDRALEETGYEPVSNNGEIRFRNCPFHALREQDQETTCCLNVALVEGMVAGAGVDADARFAPEEGYCCVRLSARRR